MIDLHLHSTCSDGTCTPSEVLEEAKKKELYAISLTDHDTMEGIKEIKEKIKETGIHFISGIEMSCEILEREIHILGYGIDENNQDMLDALKRIREGRSSRNQRVMDMFLEDGIHMSLERLQDGNPDTVITRAHFARVLVEDGVCKSKDQAFKKYLGDGCKYYIKKPFLEPKEAIRIIQQAGGVAVLAHPFQYKFSNRQIEEVIVELKGYGLQGLEVYHSSHYMEQSMKLRGFCETYDLIETGGSDFHGRNKPDIQVGIGRGGLKVPNHLFDILKNVVFKN